MTSVHDASLSIAALNRCDMPAAARMLEQLIEQSPWLARRVAAARPFADLQALGDRFEAEIRALSDAERLTLLRAYPEPAPPAPDETAQASHAARARPNLGGPDADIGERLRDLSRRHRTRHGFPFIAAPHAGAEPDDVIAGFAARLEQATEAEIERALDAVVSAIRARLARHAATAADARPPLLREPGGRSEDVDKRRLGEAQRPTDLRQSGPGAATWSHAWLGAVGGVGLFALAMFFILGGIELEVGAARRLGPGAFPALSGLALALIALGVVVADVRRPDTAQRPDWVSFLAIGAALAIFALVAEQFGLVPAVFLATVTASLPDRSLHWFGKPVLGAGVALASWALFIGVLDLPIQPLRGF